MLERISTINIEWDSTTLEVVYTYYSGYGYNDWCSFCENEDIIILGVFWNGTNIISHLTSEQYKEIKYAIMEKLIDRIYY